MPGAAGRACLRTDHANQPGINRGDGAQRHGGQAAYRACCEIECEREGRTHDYSRKKGLEASEIVLPEECASMGQGPGETLERRRTEGAEQGQAGEVEGTRRTPRQRGTVPVYLSVRVERAGQAEGGADHCPVSGQSRRRSAVDFNIHEPGKDGDERNHHCHMNVYDPPHDGQGLRRKGPGVGRPENRAKTIEGAAEIHCRYPECGTGSRRQGRHCQGRISQFRGRGSTQKPTQQHQGPGTSVGSGSPRPASSPHRRDARLRSAVSDRHGTSMERTCGRISGWPTCSRIGAIPETAADKFVGFTRVAPELVITFGRNGRSLHRND